MTTTTRFVLMEFVVETYTFRKWGRRRRWKGGKLKVPVRLTARAASRTESRMGG